ncbi:XRE family transcriptional regulator [Noviherbaspirillum sp. CPCC 100848]|uniref:XRE family transcriptional regulator n=1 Tax=Noviherbaspirillum album TaxID=3080276 RepID=A0ABU6JI74_9BURK|nr:XRE family transcriptional regulator [Noviherbaspirillum sp. CPCC 100848]MEC4723108.1 XRE family transcriptional regulator [Noviherbaspirillum sp. CPCC 100848]
MTQSEAVSPTGITSIIGAATRRERERAGVSVSELAKRAGISKSTLSQIEAGAGNPSIETLWALSLTLGIPVSRLIEPPRARVQVIRAGEGPSSYSEQANYAVTLLSSCPPGSRRDIYRVQAQPGEPRRSEPHSAGVVEHLVLMSGRARAGPANDTVELHAGDYMTYPADEPHIFEALEKETTAIIVVEYV